MFLNEAKMKKFFIFFVLAFFIFIPNYAKAEWSPLGVGFYIKTSKFVEGADDEGRLNLQFPDKHNDVHGLRLNLFAVVENRNVYGFDLGFGESVSKEMAGFQVSGSSTADDMYGFQTAWIGNRGGNVTGVQIGAFYNFNASEERVVTTTGMQVAGVSNFTIEMYGAQFSGVVNISDTVTGVQIAGVFNYSEEVAGLQVSAVNISYTGLSGVQLGIANYAEDATGLQIGLYNHAVSMKGIQIGLINRIDSNEILKYMPIINASF